MNRCIEIHRKSAFERHIEPDVDEWRSLFHENWGEQIRRLGVKVEVFLWERLHDRFLFTRRGGVSLSNSLDVDTVASSTLTATVLTRAVEEEKRNLVDKDMNPSNLVGRFSLP